MTLEKGTEKRKKKKGKSKPEGVKFKKAKLTEVEKEKEIQTMEKKEKKKLTGKRKAPSDHDEKIGSDQKETVPSKEPSAFNPKKKIKKRNKKHKVANESKKDTDELPGFDHVPSDSEEEEKNSEVVNPKEKKLYTDFTVNTIFVGNLPLNYDKKKTVKFFSKFGKVVCARIRCIPIANINMRKKVAAIKKEFNPKRNSLVAYVKFDSGESVKKALEANGMVLDGHHLRIDNAEESGERDLNKAIFVGGLPFDIEDDELWEFFEKCGKIRSVRVIRDSYTTMGKGIGYVNFESTTAVELALQMDGQELKKRCINVKRCLNTVKKNTVIKSFGKKKTKEMVGELLSKKNQTKLKKKKGESTRKQNNVEFLGTKATMKKKKKKKLNQEVLRRKKIVKILKK